MGVLPDKWMVDRAEGGVLPALVLGWDAVPPRDAPPFVMEVGHQFGGYACLQVMLSGLVLPLHDNLERASRDPSLLLEGLRCIAESQGLFSARPPRSECLLVDAWGYTHGNPMTRPDLEEWDSLLSAYYSGLPRLDAGVEGMLTFSPNPSPPVIGWRALESVGESGVLTRLVVDGEVVGALAKSRPSDRASTPPRLYLLWENSD